MHAALQEVPSATTQVTLKPTMQGLVAERDKAFRGQAFALKQANTRAAQLQQQQAELASREAALMEELSHAALQGQTSTADWAQMGHEQVMTLKKMSARRMPSGAESMRRPLEPVMSTGESNLSPFQCVQCPGLLLGIEALDVTPSSKNCSFTKPLLLAFLSLAAYPLSSLMACSCGPKLTLQAWCKLSSKQQTLDQSFGREAQPSGIRSCVASRHHACLQRHSSVIQVVGCNLCSFLKKKKFRKRRPL